MPDSGTIRVEGARQLRSTMKKAGEDLEELREAHAAAARVAATAAQGKAPRVSGDLAGSVRSSGTKTAGVIRAGFARVPYAGPINYGWPSRNIEPQPFMNDGASSTESTWINIYWAAVTKIVNRIHGD